MNFFLPILLACVLWVPSLAHAATITGSVLGSSGTNRLTSVICVPLNGPRIIGTNYIYPVTQTVQTDTNGVFTLQTVQGDYGLTFGGGAQAVTISVPDSTNTLSFLDLINTNGLTYVYRTPGALVRTASTDPSFGFLSQKLTNGTSIVFTTITNAAGHAITISLSPSIQGTSLTLLGSTNQITFGAAGVGPADTNNVVQWVASQVAGDTNAYWLPLYQ
jgi:hypothetical protein